MLMEQVVLGSSLNELYFGILTVHNGSAELPGDLLLYVFIWGKQNFLGYLVPPPVLVNFGTVIAECKNVLPSNNEEVEHV